MNRPQALPWSDLRRRSRPGSSPSTRRRPTSFQAGLEALERLTLLSNFVVTGTADSGLGSLRAALNASNSASGQTNTISFNIMGSGVQKVALLSALPAVTNPVVIDATAITGYTTTPLIELDGTNAKAGANGLVIAPSAAGTVVKGLDLHSFGGDGIDVLASDVVLSANFIGTGPFGLGAAPNLANGVVVRGSDDTIGGVNVFNPDGTFQVMGGNLVSGNGGNGVVLAGSGNVVEGDRIGVNFTGDAALGNSLDGVVVDGVSSNTVGGTSAGTRNVISGNLGQGVSVANVFPSPPTSHSFSAGPLTLTPAGIAAGFSLSTFATNFPSVYGIGPLGNAFLGSGGVLVSSYTQAVYKFPSDTDGQVATAVPKVSYGSSTGDIAQIGSNIYMGTGSPPGVSEIDSSGKVIQFIAAVPDLYGVVVDTAPGPMFDHLLVMVDKSGSNPAAIYDVDPIAKTAKVAVTVPAGGDGIVFDPTSNTAYIALDGYGVRGYNLSTKLLVFDSGHLPSAYDTCDGISIGSGDLRNELFVNTNQGAIVEVSIASPSTYTVIASGGSRGDWAIVDPNNGTFLLSQTDRIVRLTPPLGSGFKGGPTTTTSGNLIEGNLIGLGADGKTPEPNASNGVLLSAGATGNTIGGTLPGQGNAIAGNKSNGVAIVDPGTSGNAVLGNSIGTDLAWTLAAGNLGNGVFIGSAVSSNRVVDNTIANNALAGVSLNASPSVGNSIQANRIYDNKGPGIQLGPGSNSGQSFPVLTAAYAGTAATYVVGSAAGTAGSFLTIDFYANTAEDPSGYGQGQFYLGSTTVAAGSTFHALLPVAAVPGQWVSATSTSASGDTSQFSADLAAANVTTSATLTSSALTSTYGQGVDFTATITGTPAPTGTVRFLVDGMTLGNAVPIDPATGVATSSVIASLSAGAHAVTAIYSGDTLRNGLTTTITQGVKQAHLTVTADPETRPYGAPNPALTDTLSGFVNGDTPAVVTGTAGLSSTATTASGVGAYPIGVTVGTLSAANYDFTPLVNGTLTVAKAPLTVTADAESMTYGQSIPTLAYAITGFLNGDTPLVVSGAPGVTTGTGTLSAGTYSIVVTPGTLSASNYSFPHFADGILTVAKAPLTVTADGEAKRVNAPLPMLTFTVTGFVSGDTPAAISGAAELTPTATASSPAGTYAIDVSPGTLSALNYTFANLVGGSLVVGTESPASFTGAGHSQPAIFRRVDAGLARWFVKGDPSLTGGGHPFGAGGLDIPLSGDFDGDGKTDLAVYRPSTAQWYVQESGSNYAGKLLATFGYAGVDIPVPGNYNGDGTTGVAVYRPTTGQWFVKGRPGPITFTGFVKGDIPVPGDYDDTGKDELAVYRPGTSEWIIDGPNGVHTIAFGGSADVPVPGAFDALTTGDQALEPAVWRPATGQFFVHGPNGNRVIQFAVGDIPAPGDYEGVGEPEVSVYRPSTGQWLVVVPDDKSPRVLTTYGGPDDIPTDSPYRYRAI